MNLNELFRELEEELKRGNYTKEQKIGIINDVGNMYRNQTDKELNDYLTRQYLGTAFEIGSAAIPVGGISGQIAKKVVPAAITKTMGRKISQDVAAGAIGGAIDGAVFGSGRGLVEDENILKTAAQDGLLGLGIGGAFGGVTGKINKFNDAKSIKNLGEYGSLSKAGKKSYRDEINKYYSNYELGKNPNVSGIGTVKLSSDAMKETLVQKPELGKEVINLSDNLKKSVYKHPEAPEHSHKYNITEFHRVGNGNTDYLIAKNSKGDNYFHKAVTPDLIAGPKPEGQGLPINSISDSLPKFNLPDWTSSKLTPLMVSAIENNNIQKIPNNTSRTPDIARDYVRMTPPTYSGSALDFAGPKPAAHETHNNKITDYMNKNNLPDWTSSKLTPPIVSAADKYVKDEFNIPQQNSQKQGLQKPFELRIEKRQYGNNAPIDIETPAGYSAPVEENKPGYRDLTGYKNPLSGDNRIYTAEDIGEMSGNEFGKLEKEIDAQINTIGIPRKKDLGVFSGGTIYITPYTRSDGVKVRGHFRAMRSY